MANFADQTQAEDADAYDAAAKHKSFQSIEIREVRDGKASPDSAIASQTPWSEFSSSESQSLQNEKATDEIHASTSQSFTDLCSSLKTGWNLEVTSLIVAAASIAGIIGVLAHFSGRALPEWPLNITLNTLIALLATVANANLSPVVQSGLSQLKWIRFKDRAPLADMEAYDDASRGTWGALKLLVRLRGGFFGSFGAVVAIIALALGPFAQQVATYRQRLVLASSPATIPTALNYTGVLPGSSSSDGFVPILPMKSAVYYGLFSESDPSANLKFNCPTGNCTWPEFDTLAVCSSCVDLTPFLSRYCAGGTPNDGNVSSCGWQVPQGAHLNSSADVFSMTSKLPSDHGTMPYTTIMKLIFMGTEAQNLPPLNYNPWATQCTLSYCLQTFQSSTMNGIISEKVISMVENHTIVDISSNHGADIPVVLSTSKNVTYEIGMGAMLGIRSWFADLFKEGSATRNSSLANSTRSIPTSSVIVNLTVGISSGTTYFDSDIVQTFYWDYYEYATGLPDAMSSLATAMTVAFRSFNGAIPVEGIAFSTETYVHVRWGWIALPVVVVIFTAIFLSTTIFLSQRSGSQAWKSSALAMLFHGLDEETRERFGGGKSLKEKKRVAKSITVKLDDSGDGRSLLRFM
ncbi:hypothetical protein MMC25_001089 [Agyrium rufum]|nr:hypothetical protein [Agyrium rufum]